MYTTIFLTLGLITMPAAADVYISELMYDPASPERRGEAEWVELVNRGSKAVTLDGWKLDDEDASDWGPLSGELAPGQVAVIINGDASTTDEFKAAWTEDPEEEPVFLIIAVKWGSLANKPDEDNEVLTLIDDTGDVICMVNYGRGGDWPDPGRRGASIHLTRFTEPRITAPANWSLTKAGEPGVRTARPAGIFTKPDVGSPGFIPGALPASTAPEPTPPPSPKEPAAPTPPTNPATPPATPPAPKSPPPPPVEDDDVPY